MGTGGEHTPALMAIRGSLPCPADPSAFLTAAPAPAHGLTAALQLLILLVHSRALQMLNYDVESVPCMVLLNTAGG
jgi:hypothetical protein